MLEKPRLLDQVREKIRTKHYSLPFAHFKSRSANFGWMAKISRSGDLKAYFFNVLQYAFKYSTLPRRYW